MNEAPAFQPASTESSTAISTISSAEIDASCRLPLLVLFLKSGAWLVIASAFGLIASIKFHSPSFLADTAWLTYGRVRPACVNSMLYGFCLQAGLGVGLWLLARLGGTLLARRWLVTVGTIFWNLGVAIGVIGILAGDSTGFENLEMPAYAALIVFLGCLMIGLCGVLTFHQRRERPLFVSQWFLLAALFWFPWIYPTAQLLLVAFPVRGVTQSVIAWWFSNNLHVVWLGLVGLAAGLYFVPKLAHRPLHSYYLALVAFWGLILFGSWGGIPGSAPVPAWMPTLSAIATVLMIIPIIAVALNVYHTAGRVAPDALARLSSPFVLFGMVAFLVAGLMRIFGVLPGVTEIINFTWGVTAQAQLNSYGFFAMTMFGAIYYIAPRLTGIEFPSAKLVRAHFWLAAVGVLFIVAPLAAGGIAEGLKLRDLNLAFTDVAKSTLPFLRVSTVGDLLIALGHVVFLLNLSSLACRFYRVRIVAAYAAATAPMAAAEVKP